MAKAPKKPKEIILKIPQPMVGTNEWLIIGIDPSLSRTGYALMHVQPKCTWDAPDAPMNDVTGTATQWLNIGSFKPEFSSDPDWVRSKAMGLCLKKSIMDAVKAIYASRIKTDGTPYGTACDVGLIVSFEYPTTMNTHLTSLNRILKLVMLDKELQEQFSTIRIQETNAATLRSMMGLKMKGTKNKALENIPKAYTFVDKAKYPELDTDSCDAVLLAMVARHTASIMLGFPDEVPEVFKNRFCDSGQEMKGKGNRAHIIVKGLLHRPEYWFGYKTADYQILLKNASNPKKKLERIPFSI